MNMFSPPPRYLKIGKGYLAVAGNLQKARASYLGLFPPPPPPGHLRKLHAFMEGDFQNQHVCCIWLLEIEFRLNCKKFLQGTQIKIVFSPKMKCFLQGPQCCLCRLELNFSVKRSFVPTVILGRGFKNGPPSLI